MNSIFEYLDYRTYLRDFYKEKKREKRFFSHRYFARRAGIKSPVFLKLVMDGERNLTSSMTEKFIVALGFGEKEAVFFRNLVLFNQAKTAPKKQEHYCVLRSMKNVVAEYGLGADAYDFYSHWCHAAIREFICLRDFGDDWEKVGAALVPTVTASTVRKSVDLLKRLGLVRKRPDGRWEECHGAIASGVEVQKLALRNYNREMIHRANEALDVFTIDKRHASGVTMGISAACYEMLLTEIEAFRERVVGIVNEDKNSRDVYQLNIQLFPLNKNPGERNN